MFFSGWMNQWQIPGRASSLVVIHQLQRELRVGAGVGRWDESGGGMEVRLIVTLFLMNYVLLYHGHFIYLLLLFIVLMSCISAKVLKYSVKTSGNLTIQ